VFNTNTCLAHARTLGLFTTGILGLATSQAFAQSIEVTSDLEVLTFDITDATPSGSVTLAIDFAQCSADVNGDRLTDANDTLTNRSAFGPTLTPDRKTYDLNNDGWVNERDAQR